MKRTQDSQKIESTVAQSKSVLTVDNTIQPLFSALDIDVVSRDDLAMLSPIQQWEVLEHLHDRYGNQTVQRVFAEDHEQSAEATPSNLRLNAIGDQYEQEADVVAKQVVRKISDSSFQKEIETINQDNTTKPAVQSKRVMADGNLREGGMISTNIAKQIEAARSGGEPLPVTQRIMMEQAFDADFRDVKIHKGEKANKLNQMLNARAFTTSKDIFFGEGEFQTNSITGNALLAHELTHVVQQTGITLQPSNLPKRDNNVQIDNLNLRNGSTDNRRNISDHIQRYDSFEHAQLGDKAGGAELLNIRGVNISMGEINALGDFYANPEDVINADPKELKRLVELLRNQRANPNSVSEEDWEKATQGRYLELAENNSVHFSPSNEDLIASQPITRISEQNNRSAWISYHKEALQWANRSSNMENSAGQYAKVVNSFADHFLTDAFSAGHLFNKDDVMAIVENNLQRLPFVLVRKLLLMVAHKVYSEHGDFISSSYEFKMGKLGFELNTAGFYILLEGVYLKEPTKIYNAIVKAAHDNLNAWPNGVPVENDFDNWNLSGDDTLKSSPETQFWAQRAIEESRANIEKAMKPTIITEEEIDELVKRVLAYFPRPTEISTKIIHDMLSQLIDPLSQMVPAITQVLSDNIGMVLRALVQEGIIQPKPERDQTGHILRKLFIEQDPEYVNWFIKRLSGI